MEYEVSLNNKKLVVKETNKKYEIDLRKRLFNFAADTVKFLMTLPFKKELDVAPPWNKKSIWKIMKLYQFQLNHAGMRL